VQAYNSIMLNSRSASPLPWKKLSSTTGQSSVVPLNFGLVKVASALPQSRSSPAGSWQKLFSFTWDLQR